MSMRVCVRMDGRYGVADAARYVPAPSVLAHDLSSLEDVRCAAIPQWDGTGNVWSIEVGGEIAADTAAEALALGEAAEVEAAKIVEAHNSAVRARLAEAEAATAAAVAKVAAAAKAARAAEVLRLWEAGELYTHGDKGQFRAVE